MSAQENYWQEAFELALDGLGLYSVVEAMTPEQRAEVGKALATSHEHYGLAFYSPPASDRISSIEREYQQRLAEAERRMSEYQDRAEGVLRRVLHQHSDARLSIDQHGNVVRWGGRIEVIA